MIGNAAKRLEEIRRERERPRRRSGEPKREKEAVSKASDGNASLTSRCQSQPQELEGRHPRSDRVRGYTPAVAAAVAYTRDHDLPSSTGESPAMITSRRAAASPVQPMIEAVSHFASYLAGLSQ